MLPTDRLHELVAAKRAEHGVPGIAAGVVLGEDLAWFDGNGWADLETGLPPVERSLARVASVTKTFTATAVLQLVDRGNLRLDDPLEMHLPEFGQVLERGGRRADVTIRRLLTHRSGLVTESPPTNWGDPSFPSMPEILAALPRTAVFAPPDVAGKYSNLAFALLGEVVARLSGRTYVEFVRAEIFEPLELRDLTFEPDADARALMMTGYSPAEHEDRPNVVPNASLNGLTAAGQLHANVHDLARWVAFQTRGSGRTLADHEILTAATMAESQRPQYVEPDFSVGQCLAWRMTRVGDRVFHNHGGSVHGFNSSVGFHMPTRVGIIVLANLWPTTVAAELALALFEAVVGSAVGSAAGGAVGVQVRPASAPPEAAPHAVRQLLGRYRAEPGIVADLDWREGALRLLSPAGAFPLHTPSKLEPLSGRGHAFRFVTGRAAGEEIAFVEAAESGELRFEVGGFVYRRNG
jgi:D-alanyl-D-alanine carboxypeptidase